MKSYIILLFTLIFSFQNVYAGEYDMPAPDYPMPPPDNPIAPIPLIDKSMSAVLNLQTRQDNSLLVTEVTTVESQKKSIGSKDFKKQTKNYAGDSDMPAPDNPTPTTPTPMPEERRVIKFNLLAAEASTISSSYATKDEVSKQILSDENVQSNHE